MSPYRSPRCLRRHASSEDGDAGIVEGCVVAARFSTKRATALVAFAMTIYIPLTAARAADAEGHYYVGGGVGGLKCPSFLNDMTEVRQLGGLHSITGGASRIAPWQGYVLGFETGYNLGTPGIVDVFASLGSSDTERLDNVIYWIESWCLTHPDKLFGSAVAALAQSLQASH
jgi:hypothetical protein